MINYFTKPVILRLSDLSRTTVAKIGKIIFWFEQFAAVLIESHCFIFSKQITTLLSNKLIKTKTFLGISSGVLSHPIKFEIYLSSSATMLFTKQTASCDFHFEEEMYGAFSGKSHLLTEATRMSKPHLFRRGRLLISGKLGAAQKS